VVLIFTLIDLQQSASDEPQLEGQLSCPQTKSPWQSASESQSPSFSAQGELLEQHS